MKGGETNTGQDPRIYMGAPASDNPEGWSVARWTFVTLAKIIKPIFHWKLGLRWLQNADEINTKNMKCTCPTPAPTPEGPTPPIFH